MSNIKATIKPLKSAYGIDFRYRTVIFGKHHAKIFYGMTPRAAADELPATYQEGVFNPRERKSRAPENRMNLQGLIL